MARKILDQTLLAKIATNKGKSQKYIGEMVSKLAHKHSVSSEAALVYIARQCGIGTNHFLRKLDASKRAEVQVLLSGGSPEETVSSDRRRKARPITARPALKRSSLKKATKLLLQDAELRRRCIDLLAANSQYDRAINQATVVLEDRIRKKATPPTSRVGEALVNFAFNEDISKTVLRVSSGQAEDQRGFTQILRGIVPAFRNPTHHHISERFSQEDAILVVGFIDVLLRVVESTVVVQAQSVTTP